MNSIDYDRLCKIYWDLWEQVQSDPEYARLRSELEAMEEQYEAILAALPEEHRITIDRTITLRETMNRRILECACGELAFPKKES